MIQYIIVTIVVLLAFFAALIPLFRKKKQEPSCGSGCSGCPLADSKGEDGGFSCGSGSLH